MARIRIYKNTHPNHPCWKIGHLPVRQTLVWVGPAFILIQR